MSLIEPTGTGVLTATPSNLSASSGNTSVVAIAAPVVVGTKLAVYQELMRSVRDLIPDIDRYIRMKIFGTPTTSEYYLGQPECNIYGAKLIPKQVGLNRLGYKTELPNLFLVGATAGYPSVPGVIGNGMDVAEMLTGESVRNSQSVAFKQTSSIR